MALIVNGKRIEDSVIQQEFERLRPDYERVFAEQSPEEQKAQLLNWSRENVIEKILIEQEAKKREPIPQAQIESAFEDLKTQYKDQNLPEEFDAEDDRKIKEAVELNMRVDRMLSSVYKDIPKPSEEAILKFYEENKEQFTSAEQIRVFHIVKHINWQTDEAAAYETIRRAQAELKNGAIFETLVAKYSDCPENGCDLGYITRGQMVEEFEDVVFNLGINEASDVFRTRFGFHIAKLYDRKPAVVPGLKEVKSEVLNALKAESREKALEK